MTECLDVCKQHEVRFFRGLCSICVMKQKLAIYEHALLKLSRGNRAVGVLAIARLALSNAKTVSQPDLSEQEKK